MKKSSNRAIRMGEQIHKDIMQILRTKVKDPRVEWVTVNEVEVTNDYSLARVFYSVLKSENKDAVAKVLDKAKGFIRSELAKGLTTYTVPELRFVFDTSLERGGHILSLISKVSEEFTDDNIDEEDSKQD
jgi:ribosome-binding factor A